MARWTAHSDPLTGGAGSLESGLGVTYGLDVLGAGAAAAAEQANP